MTLLELVACLTLNGPNLTHFQSVSHSFPLQMVGISVTHVDTLAIATYYQTLVFELQASAVQLAQIYQEVLQNMFSHQPTLS